MTTHTSELQKRVQHVTRPSATTQPRAKKPTEGSGPARPASELLLSVFFFLGFALLLDPLLALGQAGTRSGDLLQMIRPYAVLPVLGLLIMTVTGYVSWPRLCWRINHARRLRDDHCPRCDGTELRRTRRQPLERRVARMGIPVRRYICRDCRWHGLRVKGSLVED